MRVVARIPALGAPTTIRNIATVTPFVGQIGEIYADDQGNLYIIVAANSFSNGPTPPYGGSQNEQVVLYIPATEGDPMIIDPYQLIEVRRAEDGNGNPWIPSVAKFVDQYAPF